MALADPARRTDSAPRVSRVVALVVLVVAVVAVSLWRGAPQPPPRTARPVDRTAPPPTPAHERRHVPVAPALVAPAPTPELVVVEVPEPPSRDVAGTVVDADGGAVEGATVALFAADEWPLGSVATDASGAFRFEDAADTAALLVARRPPHALTFVDLTPPPEGVAAAPVVVVLGRGSAIEGEVRMTSGGAPRAPVHVLVRPWTWTPGLRGGRGRDVERLAAEGDPRLLTAEAGVDGRFRVEGLVAGRDYLVHAGGEGLGLATVDMVSVVRARAGGDPVTLWLAPLYVFDVRVVGEDGESLDRLPVGVQVSGVGPMSYTGPFGGSHPVEGLWSGVAARTDDAGRYSMRVFKTAPYEAERSGPYRLSVAAPGYRAATHEVWAYRVRPGVDGRQELRLERVVDELGALRIRFDDHGSGFVAALAAYPESNVGPWDGARLVLLPVGERPPGVTCLYIDGRALAPGVDRIDLPRMPCARYELRLHLPFGAAEARAWRQEVTIAPDGVAEITVPAPTWAGLDVQVAGDGPPPRGLIELRVRIPGHKGCKVWHFLGLPARVVGMAPGTYEVEIACRGLRTTARTVDLLPDCVTTVVWETVAEADAPPGDE